MPSKKKKYNSRFPPARIKKIMQADEEVGKVAQVVPVVISKALEMFVASLLQSSSDITRSRNARTLTPNHIKQSILSSEEFQFLRDLAQTIPDVNPGAEGEEEEVGAAGGGPSATAGTGVHSLQRRVSENRSTTAMTSSGHQMSAAGQTAAIGFRGRGRPRKRVIPGSQTSVPSMASTEEPEDDDETEEEDDDEEEPDDEEELNSDNNNRINSNNNNNHNSGVINANYYYPPSEHMSRPSPFVSTIQSTASSSAGLKPKTAVGPVIEEDDDYDN